MAFATVLTHHHHIIDAVCGILFGAIMNRLIMNPYLVKQSTGLPSKLRWLEGKTKVFTKKLMLPW
jgi:membrane-associated phospholipid phosphatase